MRWSQLVVLVGLMLGGDALAAGGSGGGGASTAPVATAAGGGGQQAKKGKKGGQQKEKPRKKKDGVQETGIKSFDRVFKEVGDIDGRLADSESQLRKGRQNLNAALGLPKGTPFSDALADLQNKAEGKLRLGVSNGAIPKLEPTDAVPANVQTAVDGFNGFTQNLTASIANVGDLSKDITRLVDATAHMPKNLVDEFSKSSGGVSIIEKLFVLPKAVKATSHNIKIVTGLDDRVTSLSHRMTDLVDLVNSSFQPMPDKGGRGGGDGRGGGNGKGKGKGKGGKKGGGGDPTGGRPIPGR
jgi:hypothetical protein